MNIKSYLIKGTCRGTATRIRALKPTRISFGLEPSPGFAGEVILRGHFNNLKTVIENLQNSIMEESDIKEFDSAVSIKLRDIDKCFKELENERHDEDLYGAVKSHYDSIADVVEMLYETPERLPYAWLGFKRLERLCRDHAKRKLPAKCHIEQLYRELSRLQAKMDELDIGLY